MGGATEILLIMNDYIFVSLLERIGDLDVLFKHPHFTLLQY